MFATDRSRIQLSLIHTRIVNPPLSLGTVLIYLCYETPTSLLLGVGGGRVRQVFQFRDVDIICFGKL